MPHVITITGPSGCGKSTAIRHMLSRRSETFVPVSVPKYTTRRPRKQERNEPQSAEAGRCREKLFVEKIPEFCDLVYEQYGVRYGLEMESIFAHLRAGESPIVVMNDVRVVEDVRSALGKLARSVFIFRESPRLAKHQALAAERGEEDEEVAWIRYRKAEGIYRIYIENIHLFDHVFLNCGEVDLLKSQTDGMIRCLFENPAWPLTQSE